MRILSALLTISLLPIGGSTVWGAEWSGAVVQNGNAPAIVQVESEFDFTAALRSDGTVWTWGQNFAGQLGLGYMTPASETPVVTYPEKVIFPEEVFIVEIAAGNAFVLARDSQRRVWQWGCLAVGEQACPEGELLGAAPVLVTVNNAPLLADRIAAGSQLAMVLTAEGQVWTWGLTQLTGRGASVGSAQADLSSKTFEPGPVYTVDANWSEEILTGIRDIAGGANHAMALSSTGTLYVWGLAHNYALGFGDSVDRYIALPLMFPEADTVVSKIYATSSVNQSIALTNHGAYGWGHSGGALGLAQNGWAETPATPTLLPYVPADITDLALDGSYTIGVLADGTLVRADSDAYGFVKETDLEGVTRVFAGSGRYFALNDDAVWTMGANYTSRQLFDAGWYLTTYNLLGNGLWGDYFDRWIDTPMPMLDFEAGPPIPALESDSLSIHGTRVNIYHKMPVGKFDKVVAYLENEQGDVIESPEWVRNSNDLYVVHTSLPLEPGHYYFKLQSVYTRNDENPQNDIYSELYVMAFEILPPTYPISIYLFGAPEDFELMIVNRETELPVQVEPAAGDGYLRYDFLSYPDDRFVLEHSNENYSLSRWQVYANRGSQFIVQVYNTEEPYGMKFDGRIQDYLMYGYVEWRDPESGTEDVAAYELYFTDANGNQLAPAGIIELGEYYNEIELDGVEIPQGAVYLQLFVRDHDEALTAANAKLRLSGPHVEVTAEDLDDAAGYVRPVITIRAPHGETGISFYMLSLEESNRDEGPTVNTIIQADGNARYTVEMPELYMTPENRIVLKTVDSEGNETIVLQEVSIADLMTRQEGMIDYSDSGYYGEPYEIQDPEALAFTDENLEAGLRAGNLSWRKQDIDVLAYDLYYADAAGDILNGIVRIFPSISDSEIVYRIGDSSLIPNDAASVAVVTHGMILVSEDAYDYDMRVVDSVPFYIPLEDRYAYSTLLTGTSIGKLQSGKLTLIPKGTTVQQLKGALQTAVSEVTAVVIDAAGAELPDARSIESGYMLRLTLGTMTEEISLEVLSTLLTGTSIGKLQSGKLDLIPRGTTVQQLKGALQTVVPEVTAVVVDAAGAVQPDNRTVEGGLKLRLSFGTMTEEFSVETLAQQIRTALNVPSNEKITFRHAAAYIIANKTDITGDGLFDRRDVRMLLGEIEA